MNSEQDSNEEQIFMTPLEARLWNRGASYAWPDVDIQQTPDEYVFSFDIPSRLRDKIRVRVENNRLFVTGEEGKIPGRISIMKAQEQNAKYSRNFAMPLPVDVDNIATRFYDGVLIVVVPKAHKSDFFNFNFN